MLSNYDKMTLPFAPTTIFEYSASSIKTFQNCHTQFYYHKLKKPHPKVPIPLEFVFGKFLHSKIENFYKPDGTPKNKSAEAFANSAAGQWKRIVSKGDYYGQEIDFREVQGKDKKALAWQKTEDARKVCKQIYGLYSTSALPLEKEYEIRFAFFDRGKIYRIIAILDEIRWGKWGVNELEEEDETKEGLIIRDHKSDYWMPEKNSLSLKHDIQFTIYPAALSFKCREDMEFARRIGVNKQDLEALAKDPFYLMDKIKIEHHHMRSSTMTPTFRKKEDFEDIVSHIDKIESFIKSIDPKKTILERSWGKHCDRCMYRKIHEEEYHKEKVMGEGYQLPLLLGVKPKHEQQKAEQLEFVRKRKKGVKYLLPQELVEIQK